MTSRTRVRLAVTAMMLMALASVAIALMASERTFVAIVGGSATVGIGVATTVATKVHRSFTPRVVLVSTICAVLAASVAHYDWPVRVLFVVSRGALERGAAEVASGRGIADRWVGAFYIRRGDLTVDGSVCFWINLNAAGRTGLVRTRHTGSFNVWSDLPLDDRWHLLAED